MHAPGRNRGPALLAIGGVIALLLSGVVLLHEERAAETDVLASIREQPARAPSHTTRMGERMRITGEISPKSVVASPDGLVIANNMMYSHSSTVYDATTLELAATVPDTVDLSEHGVDGRAGPTEGAPVEAAWSPDSRYAYVSQYRLRGPGSGEPATDDCRNGDGIGRSAVYRMDAQTLAWDQVIEVGRVPKFISLSPDGSLGLVSNWCDSTVSVLDLASGTELRQIPVDAAPRGSVILPDNRTAYVAAMYADELYRVDLVDGTGELVLETGRKPRHLVLSPDGARMYLTESGSDRLLELDTASGQVLREMPTGREPRSMAISSDGTALYIVNYHEDTVSKVDVAAFEEIQREDVGHHPIGVAYEPREGRVWVANYSGSIDVFEDTLPAVPEADPR
ncbi:YncE family protein [Brachybacterium hainanense]|uniref:YncE family protein n=1 Tax=Brachybacterium hainanense TaxID=1541174 RepID=A0ABV6REE5_9MICO